MNEESFDALFDASLCDSASQKIPEQIHPRSVQIAEEGDIPGPSSSVVTASAASR
jgi:hypothetical protein